jgi:long-chain acyl-CoA synthetase
LKALRQTTIALSIGSSQWHNAIQNTSSFFGSGNESTADQLTDDALRLADGMLVQGLKPGQRVFVLLGNRMEAAVILAACLAVRAIFVPLNPTYTVAEMDVYLRKLRPSLYFREAKYGPSDVAIPASELGIERHFFASDDTPRIKLPSWRTLLHDAGGPLPVVDPQAPAVLVHTSGTTGTPKFVAHTQTSLAQYVVQIVGYGFGDSARMVITLSCFYISGLTALINSIANGMSEELLDGCEPEAVLDATEKYRCTAFLLTPHMTSSLNKAQLMRPRQSSRVVPTLRGVRRRPSFFDLAGILRTVRPAVAPCTGHDGIDRYAVDRPDAWRACRSLGFRTALP